MYYLVFLQSEKGAIQVILSLIFAHKRNGKFDSNLVFTHFYGNKIQFRVHDSEKGSNKNVHLYLLQ